MDMNKLIGQIEIWGYNKGIIPNSTPEAQFTKTLEEVSELCAAIHAGDEAEMADAYGDIFVTLVMGASCAELDIKQCISDVYDIISKRTGEMKNGAFVKND